MLDLPSGITTCLFYLDGVLTRTAKTLRRAADAVVIEQDIFAVEPWSVAERELHLDLLAQTESIFYETRPLPYAERPNSD